MEETIKLLKVEYLSNHCMDKGEIRGNLECGSAQTSLLFNSFPLDHAAASKVARLTSIISF